MDYEPKPGLSKEERLAVIETIVGRMEQRLFGNGQAGELSHIKGRITRLEQFKWKLLGACSLAVVLVQLLVKFVFK